jgi:glucose-1-phosphate adenylyltransferase
MEQILVILLAGGVGERLYPLTRDHAKPAMPFGGTHRLIDVTLSNCMNSGLRRVYILTQHKALSLNRHIRNTWHFLPPELGEFIEILPPMKRMRDSWYLGTADAVYQNMHSVEDEALPYALILSADHVYKMDYRHMLKWHLSHKADVTLATTLVPPSEAGRFGIVSMTDDFQITKFDEKPKDNPPRSRFDPQACSASMGIYLFSTPLMLQALREDAKRNESAHDFGRNVLPDLIGRRRIMAYDFVDENKKEIRYWRDVGTIDAYYEANMDLVSASPHFNLYETGWPIRTMSPSQAPATFLSDEAEHMGMAVESLVSPGCIISGCRVLRSVLSPGVRINSHCEIDSSIILENARIGPYSKIRRAIIDANVEIPANTEIGWDLEADRAAGHFVTEAGVLVIHSESPGAGTRRIRKSRTAALRAPQVSAAS